jgi:D-alanyl-D-alanine carboxypeptidase/D-alanyl-D-alanine-endopeptidase (penicillin-binding protein 4)
MLKHSTNLTAEVAGLAATRARGRPAGALTDSGAAMSAWASERLADAAAAAPRAADPAETRASAAARLSPTSEPGPALAAGIAATLLRGEALPLATSAASAPAPAAAPVKAIDLRNHSGLSPRSRVTPRAMTGFLRAAALRGAGRAGPGRLETLLSEVRLDPRRGEAPAPEGASAVAKTGTLYFVRGLAGYVTAASGRKLAFAIFSEDLDRREALGPRARRASRGWLSRARELERRVVRAWAANY